MKLNESQIAKIDPLLQEVLMGAKGNEVIRAIMSLGDENQIRLNASNSALKPQQFASSEAYRQALIDQRKSQLAEVLGDTIEELQELSLKPVGGGLSRVVIVEGSADAILRSLALSGVNHVTLDQLIALPEVAPDAAVKHFADIYINTLDRPLDEKTTKLIYQASEQYIINYHKCHNKLQILGMQHPVDLDSIYTDVQCLQSVDIRRFESIEALQNLFRETGKRGFQLQKADKQEGIKVANQQQYLMVLGAPGAGKSTFLRKIGLEALKGKAGKLQHECIPVFIELKLFTESNINIEEVIIQAFRLCQLPFAEEFTNKALQQGQLLILLDGLDEVATGNTDLAISQIQSFVEQYKDNRFIVSCRTAAYRSQFRNLMEIAIADFDDAQIQQFIQNWFSSEVDRQAGTADKCWELIKNQESTKELARTPVLLTFLCLVNEVFLLVAGLMRGGADDLLLLMEKEAQKYINTPKLQALLNWAEQVTAGSPGDFKPVGKRAVAIAIANANAIAYAYAYAYANAKVINLTGELEELKIFNNVDFTILVAKLKALKGTIPDDKQPRKVRQAFTKHLQETLVNAFHLTSEMVNLSNEETKALENYLYATHLIIQCKQAAIQVSLQTWKAIEARMLLVPGG